MNNKLVLSPANRAKVLHKLPAPLVAEIKQPEQPAKPSPAPPLKDKQHPPSEAARKVETLLRECFPEAFRVPRPPLAIGIYDQIIEVAGPEIDPKALSHFLRWWVHRLDYLDAVAHGEPRVNLDGHPDQPPTPDQQKSATLDVYGKGRRATIMLAKIAERTADAP